MRHYLISLILLLNYCRLESLEKIKQKYYDIINRSFSTKLDLFLFSKCHFDKRIGQFSYSDFKWFTITDDLVEIYLKAWSLGNNEKLADIGLTMFEIDQMVSKWSEDNFKVKEELIERYRVDFITDLFPFNEFEKFYSLDPEKRVCHYCNINDKELEHLESIFQIKTKRIRGYSMEIDRKKPNYEYLKDNVVLACYWCNNAKSDEFSEAEFLDHVGPGIRKIWDSRRKRK